MSGFHDNALIGASGQQGYQISRSVRLRSSASAYFNRTFGTPTDNRKWTLSFWCKRGSLSTSQTILSCALVGNEDQIIFNSTNNLRFYIDGAVSGDIQTTAVFRDVSAYYHFIVVCDTANATAADRAIIYVNNVRQAVTGTNFTLNSVPDINGARIHSLGRYQPSAANYFDGYLTEVNFIDGQALDPSYFGETDAITGVWKPKKYAGTYGTNGFYLNFSDNSAATAAAIGKDYSGNGNDWTPNNISVTAGVTYDSMLDVPTLWADGGNGRGNYATWNPIARLTSANTNGQRWEDGNLKLYPSSSEGAVNSTSLATIAIPASGKWYWEITPTVVATAASSRTAIGIMSRASSFASGLDFYYSTVAGAYAYAANGQKINSPTPTFAAYGASYTANDVIGVAVDADAGTLTFYKNGTSQGTAFSGLDMTSEFFPAAGYWGTFHANFGQRPFAYTPPTGFKALNTLNLPEPTILKGNQYFDVVTYAGSASQQTITTALTGLDFAWIKNRTAARSHVLVDRVRGGSPLLTLYSDLTAAEDNTSANYNPTSFTDSGIVLGGAKLGINNASENFVLWGWKEGATQGFDIVTYTGDGVDGRTVAHNLGVAPKMVIVKSRSTVTDWNVKHASLSSNNVLQLNATNAQNTPGSGYIGDLNSSTTFTLRNGGAAITNVNGNGTTYVAYLFAEVAGFSKFGSYTGNGSADGPFIFTGFRPRFVMWKNASAAEAWLIEDTARSTYNQVALELYPSSSGAEAAGSSRSPTQQFDFLSNGFKVRGAQGQTNGNGNTIIFAAFAENPFRNALAR